MGEYGILFGGVVLAAFLYFVYKKVTADKSESSGGSGSKPGNDQPKRPH